jgi:hypothetical protein
MDPFIFFNLKMVFEKIAGQFLAALTGAQDDYAVIFLRNKFFPFHFWDNFVVDRHGNTARTRERQLL